MEKYFFFAISSFGIIKKIFHEPILPEDCKLRIDNSDDQTIFKKNPLEPQGKLDLCFHYLLVEIVKICRHWIIASFFQYVFIDMIDNIIHS